MKISESMKKHWQTPFGVLVCMHQIDEAVEQYSYIHFPYIIQEILDRISDQEYKCVCETIKNQKDSDYFLEMIKEVVKVGDKYLNIDPSTYISWSTSKNLSDRKRMVVNDGLVRHQFEDLYAMAKEFNNEQQQRD